eukprot:Nitzschia sp. Nitz4//scaffold5_size260463//201228//203703//NITZ4_001011-RA/size260463-augustus-gene-0.20-mRNA-1//1//CDS//3329555427//3075//frame0
MVEALGRQRGSSTERLPCAYLGAYRSANTIPASILSSLRGYPQVSALSTSSDLDDKGQFPLFARTIPSDTGNSIPIIVFLNRVLNVKYLAVINMNESYGNSFVQGLRQAAAVHAPEMELLQVTVDPEDTDWIPSALERIKESGYRYIFALVYGEDTHDQLFLQAFQKGMAGNGDYAWFLGDSYSGLDGRIFEPGSLLPQAYRGTGQIQASGGIRGIGLANFDTFMTIFEELNNPEDLKYLYSITPWQDPDLYPETYVAEEDFVLSTRAQISPFFYEAAVALGLAACQVSGSSTTAEGFALDGASHYSEMVNTVIHGIVNNVLFDPFTGSRDPSATLYRVSNIIPGETAEDGSVTYAEVFSHVFVNGTWQDVVPFYFGDGTVTIPADTPPLIADDGGLSTGLQVCVLLLCAIVMSLSVFFMHWTHRHRKARIVLASQPFFLYIICTGILVLGSAIIPLALDHKILTLQGCSRACTAIPWLIVLGFSMTLSALFTKTHRVNIILNQTHPLTRIKVTIWDVAKPMFALVSVNAVVLLLMTILATPTFELVVESEDNFGRPTDIRGQCDFEDAMPYISAVSGLTFLALLLAIGEAYQARNLSTEFSESVHIFKALIAIALVSFIAGPVMLLARDNSNTSVFALSALIFVVGAAMLLLMFLPKMQYLQKHRKMKGGKPRVHITGIEDNDQGNSRGGSGAASENTGEDDTFALDSVSQLECTGMKILSTKSPEELVAENESLKKQLKRATEEKEALLQQSNQRLHGNSEGNIGHHDIQPEVQNTEQPKFQSSLQLFLSGEDSNASLKQ